MVDTNSSKPVFVSCGGDDIVIWEEDTSEKKFSISKRCPMSGKTSDKHISLICWSDDSIPMEIIITLRDNTLIYYLCILIR